MIDESTPTANSPLDLDAEVPPDQSLEVIVNHLYQECLSPEVAMDQNPHTALTCSREKDML